MTINGLVRWTINRGCAGLEAWAGTPGTVGGAIFGNAHFGGRLIGELVDERRGSRRRDGEHELDVPRGRDGVRLRSQPAAATRARCCCRPTFRVGRASRRRCAPIGARVAGVPQADAAARYAERGLHFSESRARPRSRARRRPVVGRRARRSCRPEGRRDGGARVSPTHGNFIVNEGGATARRHPRA